MFSKRVLNISPSVTLSITAKAASLKAKGEKIIAFAAGEPNIKIPEYISEEISKFLMKGNIKYTDVSGISELKQAIRKKLKNDNQIDVNEKQIIVSNGAKHSIFNVLFALVNNGDEVIIPSPYWLSYPEMVKLCGGKTKIIKTTKNNNYKMTACELSKSITPKTKVIILNSPNNPSGYVYTQEELKEIVTILKNTNIYLISDEIYENFIYGQKHYSIASLSNEYKDRVITINGVSKTYSMTGYRIGYLACEESLVKKISSAQSHMTSSASVVSQYAALIALEKGINFKTQVYNTFLNRRNTMLACLKNIDNIEFIVPMGAFYFMIDLKYYLNKYKINSITFCEKLLEEAKVAAVPCEAFGIKNHVRFSYALEENEIIEGVMRFKNFLYNL